MMNSTEISPPDLARSPEPQERLIVALDVPEADAARRMVDELGDVVSFYKVGYQLFISSGLGFVQELGDRGKRVFVDLKMDDIEETVKLAIANLARIPAIKLATLHGSGATARAGRAGRGVDNTSLNLLSITLLSSLGEDDLKDLMLVGQDEQRYRFQSLDDYVMWRADQGLSNGADGVIASGATIQLLRHRFADKDFLIVSPGIRPPGSVTDDHKRTATPQQAIAAGADYLVVGRPIRDAKNRRDAAEQIIEDIAAGVG